MKHPVLRVKENFPLRIRNLGAGRGSTFNIFPTGSCQFGLILHTYTARSSPVPEGPHSLVGKERMSGAGRGRGWKTEEQTEGKSHWLPQVLCCPRNHARTYARTRMPGPPADLNVCQLILAQPGSLAFFLCKVTKFSRTFSFFFSGVISQISLDPLLLWPRIEKAKGERKQDRGPMITSFPFGA